MQLQVRECRNNCRAVRLMICRPPRREPDDAGARQLAAAQSHYQLSISTVPSAFQAL